METSKDKNYTQKFKGIIVIATVFIYFVVVVETNSASLARHKVQDDTASQIQESLHKA